MWHCLYKRIVRSAVEMRAILKRGQHFSTLDRMEAAETDTEAAAVLGVNLFFTLPRLIRRRKSDTE